MFPRKCCLTATNYVGDQSVDKHPTKTKWRRIRSNYIQPFNDPPIKILYWNKFTTEDDSWKGAILFICEFYNMQFKRLVLFSRAYYMTLNA